MTVFAHAQTKNKLVNEAANDSARLAGKIVKYRSLSEPIKLQDLEDSVRPQAWKKINVLIPLIQEFRRKHVAVSIQLSILESFFISHYIRDKWAYVAEQSSWQIFIKLKKLSSFV